MRIEYVNKLTGKTGFKELPPRLNPVRIGHHPDNHLVLENPQIGLEAGVFDNDVGGGEGWRFWNRSGKLIRVDGQVLTRRDEYLPLKRQRVQVELGPYTLTVSLDDSSKDDSSNLTAMEERSVNLVRSVHQQLLDLHATDTGDKADWVKDSYVHGLETEIEEIASQSGEIPDPGKLTAMADFLAGVGVRSALLNRLIANSGLRAENFKDQNEVETWRRLRTKQPEMEKELQNLVIRLEAGLGLEGLEDLTAQMGVVRTGFWRLWQDLMGGKSAPSPLTRRYLALRRLKEEIKDFYFGFGPLEELLDDPTINEIMVVDANTIFIEKNGVLENSGRRFLTDPLITINKIVARARRQISEAQPLADARMPDGSRVNAVMPSLALKGPCLTIRRFPRQRITMRDLVDRYKSLSPAADRFLEAAVINRRNIIVAGGTGTGKTTLLNALAGYIPDKERVVTIEDTAELQIPKPHVVILQGRKANTEGGGEVSIRDLVKNSLRMRPDRIVVGECRGGEAIDMLQAMNTGHDGSMTTLHANTPGGVIERLEVLVQQNADSVLPVEAIHRQIVSAVDLIVQLGVVTTRETKEMPPAPGESEPRTLVQIRKRKVVREIAEVVGIDEGGVVISSLFRREGEAGDMEPTGSLPTFLNALIEMGLVKDPVALLGEGDAA
jgi:Flp pilus assembly CpaF family ATPase